MGKGKGNGRLRKRSPGVDLSKNANEQSKGMATWRGAPVHIDVGEASSVTPPLSSYGGNGNESALNKRNGRRKRRRGRGDASSDASSDLGSATSHDVESASSKTNNGFPSQLDCGVASLRGDFGSIGLLLVLYTLQGVPMGLSGSIPFLLHGRISYAQQSFFSLASLPFSLKLLWAPLVDSIYHRPFGRRKSWLVPVQMLCGILMLGGSANVEAWVNGRSGSAFGGLFGEYLFGRGRENAEIFGGEAAEAAEAVAAAAAGAPLVGHLTAFFLALYLLMATQDIAVDGWALTMLSRRNVGYASTCNTIGQTLGFFVAHVGFLALNDPGICNKYLRREPVADVGLVTLESFMAFWGLIFVATTLFVWLCKREAEDDSDEEVDGPLQTYKQLLQCLRLPAIQSLCAVLLTCKAAFAVTDAATSLKLVERGMPKEELALLSPLLVLMGMIVPVVVGRLTAGPRPLSVFLFGYPLRICVTLVYAIILPLARRAYSSPGEAVGAGGGLGLGLGLGTLQGSGTEGLDDGFGRGLREEQGELQSPSRLWFYGALAGAVLLHEVASNCMYVSQMAFFARVSDPVIGGTYMTLLNTMANLGTKWPGALSLWAMDRLTWKHCVTDDEEDAAENNSRTMSERLPAWSSALFGWLSAKLGGGTVAGSGSYNLNSCSAPAEAEACEAANGACVVTVDGYNVQVAVCVVLGVVWLATCRRWVLQLQERSMASWHIAQLDPQGTLGKLT